MWICPKCGNENDENFRFCWSCGLTRPEIKTPPEVEIPVEAPKIETPKLPEPKKREIIQSIPEPKKPVKIKDDDDVLPMLTRVSGVEHKISRKDDYLALERKIFTIAVRLLGLFLVYQFLIAVPDLAITIYSALLVENADGAANLLTSAFVIPALKSLFYLFVGIYLIGGGGILLWLLPD